GRTCYEYVAEVVNGNRRHEIGIATTDRPRTKLDEAAISAANASCSECPIKSAILKVSRQKKSAGSLPPVNTRQVAVGFSRYVNSWTSGLRIGCWQNQRSGINRDRASGVVDVKRTDLVYIV